MIHRSPHTGKLIAAGLAVCMTLPTAAPVIWRYAAGLFEACVRCTEEPGECLKRAVTNLQNLPERMNPTLSETDHL